VDELAATLALLAALCFALAATPWQKAALSLDVVSVRHPKSLLALLTQWVWLLGLVAQIVGVGLQAAALDRGRVSIIQPLLVTTVIWALPLGYFLTHQAIGGREVSGAAIIVGLVPSVATGSVANPLLGAVVISSAREKHAENEQSVPEVEAESVQLATG
jgi:hypothetical protein